MALPSSGWNRAFPLQIPERLSFVLLHIPPSWVKIAQVSSQKTWMIVLICLLYFVKLWCNFKLCLSAKTIIENQIGTLRHNHQHMSDDLQSNRQGTLIWTPWPHSILSVTGWRLNKTTADWLQLSSSFCVVGGLVEWRSGQCNYVCSLLLLLLLLQSKARIKGSWKEGGREEGLTILPDRPLHYELIRWTEGRLRAFLICSWRMPVQNVVISPLVCFDDIVIKAFLCVFL